MGGWCGNGGGSLGCCHYETVKYAQIPDLRLAGLRWALLFAIAGYVAVVELLGNGGYLREHTVVGTVRLSLRQPTVGGCDPGNPGGDDDGGGCDNDFLPLDELPYCEQHVGTPAERRDGLAEGASSPSSRGSGGGGGAAPPSSNGNVYPCQIYEAVNAQLVRETSIVVWTKAVVQNETLVCDGTVPDENGRWTCPRTYRPAAAGAAAPASSTRPRPFYVAQPEAFTVLLDHAVAASSICETSGRRRGAQAASGGSYACSTQSSDAPSAGRLYSSQDGQCRFHSHANNSYAAPTGDALRSAAPCYIGANRTGRGQDFFPLGTLLEASGLALDGCNGRRGKGEFRAGGDGPPPDDGGDDGDGDCAQTHREAGATLLVNIVWNDFQHYRLGTVDPYYYYTVTWIGRSYKEQVPHYGVDYRSFRTLVTAHGVQLNVLVAGSFHQFNWLDLILTLTAAVGLLAVATTVVDACMLHLLPESGRYSEIKYETTTATAATPRGAALGVPTADGGDDQDARTIESGVRPGRDEEEEEQGRDGPLRQPLLCPLS